MYIHEVTIRNIIDIEDSKLKNDSTDTMAYFLLFKTTLSNSLIYDYFADKSKSLSVLAERTGLDKRTVSIFINKMIECKFAVKSRNNLKLISLEKDFDFRLTKKGKIDKKWSKKFIRIKLNKKYTLKDYRNIVRGIMVKVCIKSKYIQSLISSGSQISEKEQLKMFKSIYDFRSRRNILGENHTIKIGLKLIAKIMGVSKSTADRVITGLKKMRILFVKRGSYKSIGRVSDLKVNKELVRGISYGSFCFAGIVMKKNCNEYIF